MQVRVQARVHSTPPTHRPPYASSPSRTLLPPARSCHQPAPYPHPQPLRRSRRAAPAATRQRRRQQRQRPLLSPENAAAGNTYWCGLIAICGGSSGGSDAVAASQRRVLAGVERGVRVHASLHADLHASLHARVDAVACRLACTSASTCTRTCTPTCTRAFFRLVPDRWRGFGSTWSQI